MIIHSLVCCVKGLYTFHAAPVRRVASLRSLYEPLVVQDYERTLGITEADKARVSGEAAAEAIACAMTKTPSGVRCSCHWCK